MAPEMKHPTSVELAVKGNLVLPKHLMVNGIIGVVGGRIVGFYDDRWAPSCEHLLDASGKYVLPGAIDAHVHCFSAVQEGFVHTTRSAAAGGVTTVIDMPYDAGNPVMSSERLLAKRELLEREAVVDVALLATIKKTGGLGEIGGMAEAGACGFKMSLFETDPNRFPRIPDDELLEAFHLIRETGLAVGVHAENDEIVRRAIDKQRCAGNSQPAAHTASRPRVAESEAVLRAMELAREADARLHIHHATFPRIFELVRWYRDQGLEVTAETCTHYLILTEDDLLTSGARTKVNPPLRSAADQAGLWDYCANGMVDMVTSDHAPWSADRKGHADIFDNASGMPGVETLLHLVYSAGVSTGRISIHDLARLLAQNPARLTGLYPQKGELRIGADADLVVLDPAVEWVLNESDQQSTAGWSPYHGQTVRGRISNTLVRGKMVYDGQQVIAEPGYGRFVRPGEQEV
jgi:allantoinase